MAAILTLKRFGRIFVVGLTPFLYHSLSLAVTSDDSSEQSTIEKARKPAANQESQPAKVGTAPSRRPNNLGPKHNFLAAFLKTAEGEEKSFMEALLKESPPVEFLEAMGYVQSPTPTDISERFYDGKGNRLAGLNLEEAFARDRQKVLYWSAQFGEGQRLRHLFIFTNRIQVSFLSQLIIIVLADSNFHALSWRDAGGEPIFDSASLAPDNREQKLTVTFTIGRGVVHTAKVAFRVTEQGIYQFDDPTFDPPHRIVRMQPW